MINHDDTEVSMEAYKSMIKDSLGGECTECTFDEKTGFIVSPMKARIITHGHVEGLPGNLGKLTLAQVTTGEIEVLVESYLKDVKMRDDNMKAFDYRSSAAYREQVLADMRIEEFLKAMTISEERLDELYDSVYSDDN